MSKFRPLRPSTPNSELIDINSVIPTIKVWVTDDIILHSAPYQGDIQPHARAEFRMRSELEFGEHWMGSSIIDSPLQYANEMIPRLQKLLAEWEEFRNSILSSPQ